MLLFKKKFEVFNSMHKDWDKICRELSSPESSDADDDINVMSVKKNASRVAQLLHGIIPGLDKSKAGDAPKGMNRAEAFANTLASEVRKQSELMQETATPEPFSSSDTAQCANESPITEESITHESLSSTNDGVSQCLNEIQATHEGDTSPMASE